MKALSLTQPWATLVVTGEKQFETRSWKSNFKGLIAIHAAKSFPKSAKDEIYHSVFHNALAKWGFDAASLPLGAIVGTVEIVSYHQTELIDAHIVGLKEIHFGDYSEGRWAWRLRNPKILKNPIPCKGSLSLWNVPGDVEAKIQSQLRG